jgi:hypothetical protein
MIEGTFYLCFGAKIFTHHAYFGIVLQPCPMDTFALGVCPFDFQAFLPWAVGDSCPFNK